MEFHIVCWDVCEVNRYVGGFGVGDQGANMETLGKNVDVLVYSVLGVICIRFTVINGV